jgi:hypothetical protein
MFEFMVLEQIGLGCSFGVGFHAKVEDGGVACKSRQGGDCWVRVVFFFVWAQCVARFGCGLSVWFDLDKHV